MNRELSQMIRGAGISGNKTKPGHIQKKFRRKESHLRAHKTYLRKRRQHLKESYIPWWKQKPAKLQSPRDDKLRQRELSKLQNNFDTLSGQTRWIYNILSKCDDLSHEKLVKYNNLINKLISQ